jgi:site-specific recombinase XerD
MNTTPQFPYLLQSFFTKRLADERHVSPLTIKAYRDAFRLLLMFVQRRLHKKPTQLSLCDLDAPCITDFLRDLEDNRGNAARSRNQRLAAIRSFYHYLSYEVPEHSGQIQRVLAIPPKRHSRRLVTFLDAAEIKALLNAPEQKTWSGRRDHALLLVAIQSGLRVSELTSLRKEDVVLGLGSHISCMGKGRKERSTPLTKEATAVLKAWLDEPRNQNIPVLFPNSRGGQLSSDGVEYILKKHIAIAAKVVPSLKQKRVSPHVLRHTTAMELLQAGIDRSVIALWLGHENVETTQVYLDANLAMKEKILEKTSPRDANTSRYRADDALLSFLKGL